MASPTRYVHAFASDDQSITVEWPPVAEGTSKDLKESIVTGYSVRLRNPLTGNYDFSRQVGRTVNTITVGARDDDGSDDHHHGRTSTTIAVTDDAGSVGDGPIGPLHKGIYKDVLYIVSVTALYDNNTIKSSDTTCRGDEISCQGGLPCIPPISNRSLVCTCKKNEYVNPSCYTPFISPFTHRHYHIYTYGTPIIHAYTPYT